METPIVDSAPLDLFQVDEELLALQETSSDDEWFKPQPSTWTSFDDFLLRCGDDRDTAATVRGWIRDKQYWKTEREHWDTVVLLLKGFQQDDGFPPLRKLKKAFDGFEKGFEEALALKAKLSHSPDDRPPAVPLIGPVAKLVTYERSTADVPHTTRPPSKRPSPSEK
ncbi:hypothetical protein K461DRAFT_319736 [Myriangium duriaei CBS 260.36]|uniref:Uncharacterized protein n=1 Tax=Myriangium duriaei CBS 260.36 TaxID=1168546 RepID=A0A9P4MJK1_9PEZI|nr:hypothetical protein K461DRAFT_319736 [Myriangium duriaei CBS 260.36]